MLRRRSWSRKKSRISREGIEKGDEKIERRTSGGEEEEEGGRVGGGGGRERRRRKRGSKRKIHGGVAESRGIGGAKERRRSGERAMGIERVGR